MKILLALFCSFSIVWSIAQVKIPANTKADVSLIIKDASLNKGVPSALIKERFAVYTIDGDNYVSFLAKTGPGYTKSTLAGYGIIVGAQVSDIVSLKVPVSLLPNISSLPGISVLQLSGKIKPNLDKAVKDVGADSVNFGINLPERYTGKNVFIGITDWGFDYSSPMFYDTLMQNTRIYAAWDQYKTSGPAPLGFSYGTEYTSLPEFIAAGADTANIYSYATHGSHVAG